MLWVQSYAQCRCHTHVRPFIVETPPPPPKKTETMKEGNKTNKYTSMQTNKQPERAGKKENRALNQSDLVSFVIVLSTAAKGLSTKLTPILVRKKCALYINMRLQ